MYVYRHAYVCMCIRVYTYVRNYIYSTSCYDVCNHFGSCLDPVSCAQHTGTMSHVNPVGADFDEFVTLWDGADAVTNHLGADALEHQCFLIIEVGRSPDAFKYCLEIEPTLTACKQALWKAGLECQSEAGPKVFVHPDHVPQVFEYLRTHGFTNLKPRHIVVDAKLLSTVMNAVRSIPRKHQVKVKSTQHFVLNVARVDVPLVILPMCDLLPDVFPLDDAKTLPECLGASAGIALAPLSWEVASTKLLHGSPAFIECQSCATRWEKCEFEKACDC